MKSSASLADYYRDAHVRERILEYCGGGGERESGAVYLAGMTGAEGPCATWEHALRYAPDRVDALLAAQADIARSMWDRENLLLHFDLDYINIDNPAEAYTHPADLFYKIEPTYRAVLHAFHRHGLTLLPIATGRGYHFTGCVPLETPLVDALAALSPRPPAWFATLESRRLSWSVPTITSRHASAYVGMGMLAEFLTHQILRRARPRSPIPIVVNNTVVGAGEVGRECLSIDLSYAGDPLDVRHMRVAFGAYQKHRFRPDLSRQAATHAPLVAVPRTTESIEHMLSHRADMRHAARLARTASVALPDTSHGASRLLEAYRESTLARFHRAFTDEAPSARAADTTRRRLGVPRATLPACVTQALATPNDLLLQPAFIQHVTRVFMAYGLPPRDVAALIEARYRSDCGWGRRWNWMDAESRALFDVRVFGGMLVSGLDEAVDLNCRSAQEKGLCPGGECGRDLRTTRARLLRVVRP